MPSVQNFLVRGDVTETRGDYPEEAPDPATAPVTLTNLKGLRFRPAKDCDRRVFITAVGPPQEAKLSVGDEILPREGMKETDVYMDMIHRLHPSTRGPVAIFVNKDPILRDGTRVKTLTFTEQRRMMIFDKPPNKVRISALIVHFSPYRSHCTINSFISTCTTYSFLSNTGS